MDETQIDEKKASHRGRPSKLTAETVKSLCDSITLGVPYKHACVGAGIKYSTFRRWMVEGEAANSGEKREFYDSIKNAEAQGMRNNLAIITKAAREGSWQGSAWILERRYPEEFGRKERIDGKLEHSGGDVTFVINRAKPREDEECKDDGK
jgi:hypothetical protein